MKKEYSVFVRDFQSLPQGKEIELTIRDLTPGAKKYGAKRVKAIVSADPSKLPQGDTLWLRSHTGALNPKPWAIQIKGEMENALKAPPYSEAY